MGRIFVPLPPVPQADAVLSQANPVSATLYTVLDTTKNVRIISISANITWAVTQPTPLEIVVTIDGQSLVFWRSNPVSNSDYEAAFISVQKAIQSEMIAVGTDPTSQKRAFLLEGRSVKVEVRITWAITQPTPLNCRVKWAKW